MNISVVIPTYNEETTIEECLDSLTRQTIPFNYF
jgi:glycosyltransferase involved in cell wall biosynthesis